VPKCDLITAIKTLNSSEKSKFALHLTKNDLNFSFAFPDTFIYGCVCGHEAILTHFILQAKKRKYNDQGVGEVVGGTNKRTINTHPWEHTPAHTHTHTHTEAGGKCKEDTRT